MNLIASFHLGFINVLYRKHLEATFASKALCSTTRVRMCTGFSGFVDNSFS